MAREFLIAGYTITAKGFGLHTSREGINLEQIVKEFWKFVDVPIHYRALYLKGYIK